MRSRAPSLLSHEKKQRRRERRPSALYQEISRGIKKRQGGRKNYSGRIIKKKSGVRTQKAGKARERHGGSEYLKRTVGKEGGNSGEALLKGRKEKRKRGE